MSDRQAGRTQHSALSSQGAVLTASARLPGHDSTSAADDRVQTPDSGAGVHRGPGRGSARERHVTPRRPLAHPDAALHRQGGERGGEGGARTSSRDEERTRRRPRQLTGEGPDALSSDLSSSNVRSKDVTAFSFDDVQSFIVL